MFKRFHLDSFWRFFARAPRWMGENPFLGFLFLLVVALLISSFVFYQYVFVARNVDARDNIVTVRLNQQTLQEVIQVWQERVEKFNQAGIVEVRNIFAGPEGTSAEVEN